MYHLIYFLSLLFTFRLFINACIKGSDSESNKMYAITISTMVYTGLLYNARSIPLTRSPTIKQYLSILCSLAVVRAPVRNVCLKCLTALLITHGSVKLHVVNRRIDSTSIYITSPFKVHKSPISTILTEIS